MSKTDQHKHAFNLRDDLAEVMKEEIDADPRLTWDTDEADGQALFNLAESLIARGWVIDYPGSDDGD